MVLRGMKASWRRGLWAVLVCAHVAACSEQTRVEEQVGTRSEAYGLVASAAERTVFVIGATDDPSRLDSILSEADTDWPWIKVEVPKVAADGTPIDLGGPVNFDLESGAIAVTFAQRYMDTCNPESDDAGACWLTEHYVAGEEGLTGYIKVERPAGGLAITYAVDWQGITDRFEGPPQWHRHISGEVAAVAGERVSEKSL